MYSDNFQFLPRKYIRWALWLIAFYWCTLALSSVIQRCVLVVIEWVDRIASVATIDQLFVIAVGIGVISFVSLLSILMLWLIVLDRVNARHKPE